VLIHALFGGATGRASSDPAAHDFIRKPAAARSPSSAARGRHRPGYPIRNRSMFSFSSEQLALEWQGLRQRFPLDLVERVGGVAARHQTALADHFYACLLADSAASKLISHEQVKTSLH